MNSKVKILLIILLSAVMVLGLSYGKIDDMYYMDLKINEMHREAAQAMTDFEVAVLDGDIYKIEVAHKKARNIVDGLLNYIRKQEPDNTEYDVDIGTWSQRLDDVKLEVLDKQNQ